MSLSGDALVRFLVAGDRLRAPLNLYGDRLSRLVIRPRLHLNRQRHR